MKNKSSGLRLPSGYGSALMAGALVDVLRCPLLRLQLWKDHTIEKKLSYML